MDLSTVTGIKENHPIVRPEKMKKMHIMSFTLTNSRQILLARNIRQEQRTEERSKYTQPL